MMKLSCVFMILAILAGAIVTSGAMPLYTPSFTAFFLLFTILWVATVGYEKIEDGGAS